MIETNKTTDWRAVLSLFLAGVGAAFLVGKVPVSLADLRQNLDLNVFEAGLAVSLFSLIAGVSGLFFGLIADSHGHRLVCLGGMFVAIAASVAGAFAIGPISLLSGRVLEGVGFFMTTVAVPTLMLRVSTVADRPKVLGLWGAYMPTGTAIMLLLGGFLVSTIGWRGVWLVGALLLTLMIWPVAGAAKPKPRNVTAPARTFRQALRAIFRPGPALLGMSFGCYAGMFLAFVGFVPLILHEQLQWNETTAGMAGALVVAANIMGNLVAGMLLSKGQKRGHMIPLVAVGMVIGATVFFVTDLPAILRLAGAIWFSAIGGIIPSVLFAGVPVHAQDNLQTASVNGLMMQCSSFGQLLGPALAGLTVSYMGNWNSILMIVLPLAGLTMLAGFALGRVEAVTHGG